MLFQNSKVLYLNCLLLKSDLRLFHLSNDHCFRVCLFVFFFFFLKGCQE